MWWNQMIIRIARAKTERVSPVEVRWAAAGGRTGGWTFGSCENGEVVAAVEMERQFGMEGSSWSPLGGVVLVLVPCRQPGLLFCAYHLFSYTHSHLHSSRRQFAPKRALHALKTIYHGSLIQSACVGMNFSLLRGA